MPPNIYDMEWNALVRSGRIRERFEQLQSEVAELTREKNALLQELRILRSVHPVPQVQAQPSVPPPRTVPTTPVLTPIEEPAKSNDDLDATVQRFSLLELD